MENENLEQPEAQKNQEVESNTQDDNAELTKEEIADLKKKAEVSSQNFERAKKAEKELADLKKSKEEGGEEKGIEGFTPKDYLALTENKISSEDYDEVVRVAKILGKPISEALKDKTLKTIINERVEERATALATQTKSPRGSSKISGEALMEKASKGALPETDIDALVRANMEKKLSK